METRTLHHKLRFATDALDCYQCLMDARKHSSFTGDETIIEDKAETSFTAFGGYITGKNLVLERGKKIVQSWRADEAEWPTNHFSEVIFEFKNVEGGCELSFYHNDVPAVVADRIERWWIEYYWEPLRIYLERFLQ